jgi:hypothetical protein
VGEGREGVKLSPTYGIIKMSISKFLSPSQPTAASRKKNPSAAFRLLTVLSAPLRGSPNKPPALPEGI